MTILNQLRITETNFDVFTEEEINDFEKKLSDAGKYIEDRLNEAHLNEEPFPNAFVENLFPEWLYEMMTKAWPSPEFFDEVKPSRKIMDFDEGDGRYANLPKLTYKFWSIMQSAIFHKVLGNSLIKKYANYVDESFRFLQKDYRDGEWRNYNFEFERAGMMVHSPGFRLLPHIDSPRYMIIYLLYCPLTNDYADEGTDLYKLSCKIDRPRKFKTYYPEESVVSGLQPLTQKYHRNSMATFLVTPRSLHGVTIKNLQERRVINCAVKIPKVIADNFLNVNLSVVPDTSDDY